MNQLIADTANIPLEWLSIASPAVAVVTTTIKGVHTLSDNLLYKKLELVLKDHRDFDAWLKISEKFEEDSTSYKKMVRQLIYYINAINEEDMLSAYSNLLHAYELEYISKNDFLRMGFCLTKLLSEDAKYLKENIKKDRIEENLYCLSLSSNNLMYNMSRGLAENEDDATKDYYAFTLLGRMIDKYALSFGEEGKYKYNKKDPPLSEQKLLYNHHENLKWGEY